jgi:hypothetical protein
LKRNLAIVLIAVAFLAGTMTSGGFVYASFDNCEDPLPKGKPFLEIWGAICDLQDQMNALGQTLGNLSCQSGETAEFDGVSWNCVPHNSVHQSEILDVMRFTGHEGVFSDDFFFNWAHKSRDFEEFASPVGIDGIITEFHYTAGLRTSSPIPEPGPDVIMVVTLYKNGIPTAISCSFHPSITTSCSSNEILKVLKSDLIAIADRQDTEGNLNVAFRHASVIVSSET